MPAWAAWVEQSALAHAIRGGSAWYPGIETVHILGFACLVGAITVFDLRLLGLGRGISPASLAAIALPVAGAGLGVALLTGALLFITEATTYLQNPVFLAKLGLILLGLANVALFHWRFGDTIAAWPGDATPPAAARAAGGLSLVSWAAAVVCGRVIAYV